MGITVGEYYDPNSKKRKRLAFKHKIYRFFGYNQMLIAFDRTCAFCLTELTDNTVTSVCERSYAFDFDKYIYIEEHKCSCCNQKWRYNNMFSRGEYKFDKEDKKEMEAFKSLREENMRRIRKMSKIRKSD